MRDTCQLCGEEKEAPVEFVVNKTAKRGYTQKCKDCYNATRVRHDYELRSNVLRPYGLTPEDYDRMMNEQKGQCAVCLAIPGESHGILHVDHNHFTGKVRGLLCRQCNIGLGLFHEDIIKLRRAIKYLKEKK